MKLFIKDYLYTFIRSPFLHRPTSSSFALNPYSLIATLFINEIRNASLSFNSIQTCKSFYDINEDVYKKKKLIKKKQG